MLDSAKLPCLAAKWILLFVKAKRSKNFVLGASHGFKITRFCDSQNLDLDCHANPLDLLAMTDFFRTRFCESARNDEI